MTSHSIFNDPKYFLSGFDAQQQIFQFIPVTRSVISQSAFLDGRTQIAVGPEVKYVSLAEASNWLKTTQAVQPNRVLAHFSFCGSTLLAKSIEKKGHVLSYREPQIFVDLANMLAAGHPLTRQEQKWHMIIRFSLSQFRKSWSDDEMTFLKPSNWVNNMLMDMARCGDPIRIVLMDISLEAYLLANIRGGKSRLSYSMNLLNHLLHGNAGHRTIAAEIEQADLPPMQRLLRLLTVCFSIQNTLFLEIDRQRGPTNKLHRLSKDDFLQDPARRLRQVSEALDLNMTRKEADRAIARQFRYNAKFDGKVPFDGDTELAATKKYRVEFQSDLASVQEWQEARFPATTA